MPARSCNIPSHGSFESRVLQCISLGLQLATGLLIIHVLKAIKKDNELVTTYTQTISPGLLRLSAVDQRRARPQRPVSFLGGSTKTSMDRRPYKLQIPFGLSGRRKDIGAKEVACGRCCLGGSRPLRSISYAGLGATCGTMVFI
ncbi:hypothetical protein A0H81_11366 [Grifola frondosa]|uniref:Uncharacterized protein n=1 Tax=Grifola frondosa TaxID=5627 RepID=A0A1C7LXF4_GRIFR|nr:hypothetical protein A0H81_11366 [Grifola frondosa]